MIRLQKPGYIVKTWNIWNRSPQSLARPQKSVFHFRIIIWNTSGTQVEQPGSTPFENPPKNPLFLSVQPLCAICFGRVRP